MDKASYTNEGQRQLNNTQFYESTETDLTGEVIHRVNFHAHDMLQKGHISQSIFSFLTTDMLPNIHKDPNNPTGRPIVCGREGPTEKISQFVDHFIGPLETLSQ